MRLGFFEVGENPVEEAVAEALERFLDALNVAEVGAKTDDHPRNHGHKKPSKMAAIGADIIKSIPTNFQRLIVHAPPINTTRLTASAGTEAFQNTPSAKD